MHRTQPVTLSQYRNKNILDLQESDQQHIEHLFVDFLAALKIADGKGKGRSSRLPLRRRCICSTRVLSALDHAIAVAYDCPYNTSPAAAYIKFSYVMAGIAREVQGFGPSDAATLLKRIDEYNYARFTKVGLT